MRKALVVSERGRLLASFVGALAGPRLSVAVEPTLSAAGRRVRAEPFDLLIVDLAAQPAGELGRLDGLRDPASDVRLLLIVPADRPARVRLALRAGADGILLDPFELAAGEQLFSRLFAEPPRAASGHESLDALATFLRGLAHEILNPLMNVSGILQLLRKDPAATPEIQARYEAMWQGAERIHKTIRELEHFVKAKKPQRARFDPARFLRERIEKWAGDSPPLAVNLSAPERAAALLGDPEQLALALLHLVRFAAGADGKGAVGMELVDAAPGVEITVTGRAAVNLPARPADLFIPYQDARGTGRSGSLELASAYGIFRAHQGSIAVAGAPDGGVRFVARLPRRSELQREVSAGGVDPD